MDREKWLDSVDQKEAVIVDTTGGYTFEQVMWSRNTSKDPKYWFRIHGKEKFLFRSEVAESWEFKLPKYPNPIRNMKQVYLYFKDSGVFLRSQRTFQKEGVYTKSKPGSPLYELFWDEEERRCHVGYEVEGVRISARHYFMLNYGRMKARYTKPDGSLSENKIETFPGFVDFQYYLANEIEWWYVDYIYSNKSWFLKWFPIATEIDFETIGKQGGAIPKARRKGLTYFNANAINTYNYVFLPNSYNIIGAYQESFYGVLLNQGVKPGINWVNEHTPWQRRSKVLARSDNFRASYKDKNEYGIEIERGYKSEINCITFNGTAFAGIGNSADSLSIEEAGKFNNLLDVWAISIEPLIKEGDVSIGSCIIFGTAGEMDGAGGSLALSQISYNPGSLGLVEYDNIYDEVEMGTSSIFIDALWFFPTRVRKKVILGLIDDDEYYKYVDMMDGEFISGVDDQGNSHRYIAEVIIKKNRERVRKAGNKAYQNYLTQYPIYLAEAFLVNESSPFDKALAREAKAELALSEKTLEVGAFSEKSDGSVIWRQDFTKTPILKYPNDSDEEEGCWIIFSQPEKNLESNSNLRYIAGMDPIDNGYEEKSSDNKHSLASTYIMDTLTGNLVAAYTGRPARAYQYYREVIRGLKYYDSRVMYENNLAGFYQYCHNQKCQILLADEPTILKGKVGYKMGKQGTKGFHATEQINLALRESVASWLEDEVMCGQDGDTGEPIMKKRYFTIEDMGLLEEIEKWTAKGNFDRISALMALILYYEQTANAREHSRILATKKKSELFTRFEKKYTNTNYKINELQ